MEEAPDGRQDSASVADLRMMIKSYEALSHYEAFSSLLLRFKYSPQYIVLRHPSHNDRDQAPKHTVAAF
jgi:hypothetical protein